MKIVKLQTENFKRVKAVEISPDGNTVVITGKNGQGKSSILDSIVAALGGKDALKRLSKPIRDGENKASVTVDLGDFTVTRTWNMASVQGDGDAELDNTFTSYLTVKTKDGATYSSPQSFLDEKIGALSFDPLAFARLSDKEQCELLLSLVDVDVQSLDAEYKATYDERTLHNRDVKTYSTQLATMTEFKEKPARVDVSELKNKLREAQAKNADIDIVETKRDALKNTVERLEQELKQAKESLDGFNKANPTQEKVDTDELFEKMQAAEDTNKLADQYEQREQVLENLESAKGNSEECTKQLSNIQKQKAEAIEKAKLPVAGLGVDDNVVTLGGIPFAQLSSAEQIKVSLAIAMAMNPKLKVILIKDGSLLDSDNWQIVKDMATENDYSIWVETVDDKGEVGFIIEDGAVKNS